MSLVSSQPGVAEPGAFVTVADRDDLQKHLVQLQPLKLLTKVRTKKLMSQFSLDLVE